MFSGSSAQQLGQGQGRVCYCCLQPGSGGRAHWALWVLRRHPRPGGHLTSSHPTSSRPRPLEQGPVPAAHMGVSNGSTQACTWNPLTAKAEFFPSVVRGMSPEMGERPWRAWPRAVGEIGDLHRELQGEWLTHRVLAWEIL